MTRPENWKHPDHYKPRDDSPASNTPGPLSAARGTIPSLRLLILALRQSIPARNFYSEESYQMRRRSPDRVSTPVYNANSPYTNMTMNNLNSLQRYQQNLQPTATSGNRLGSTSPKF